MHGQTYEYIVAVLIIELVITLEAFILSNQII